MGHCLEMVTLAISFLPKLPVDKRRMKTQKQIGWNIWTYIPSLVALKDFVDFVLHFKKKKNAVVIFFLSVTPPIMLKYFFISCENFGDVI